MRFVGFVGPSVHPRICPCEFPKCLKRRISSAVDAEVRLGSSHPTTRRHRENFKFILFARISSAPVSQSSSSSASSAVAVLKVDGCLRCFFGWMKECRNPTKFSARRCAECLNVTAVNHCFRRPIQFPNVLDEAFEPSAIEQMK
jgi:hypothetical protein